MIWYAIVGFLAAFGALCVLWILLGAWLTGPASGRVILCPPPGREEKAVRRWQWMRNLGLVKGALTVVCAQRPIHNSPGVEFVTLEQLCKQLEQEREP